MDIDVRLPRPYELVGSLAMGPSVQVAVMFYGTGATGAIFRVVDANGAERARQSVSAGGSGEFGGPIAVSLPLTSTPATIDGTLEIYVGHQASGAPATSVPIQFGHTISAQYMSFVLHTVQPGESLWSIAETNYQFGGRGALWNYIYQANRHQITNPNLIHPGQLLFVPLTTETEFDHG